MIMHMVNEIQIPLSQVDGPRCPAQKQHSLMIWTFLLFRSEDCVCRHWNEDGWNFSDVLHSLAGPKVFGKLRGDLDRKFSDVLTDPEDAITGYLYHCNAQNPSWVYSVIHYLYSLSGSGFLLDHEHKGRDGLAALLLLDKQLHIPKIQGNTVKPG